MKNSTHDLLHAAAALTLLLSPALTAANKPPPIRLSIDSPNALDIHGGLLLDEDWALTFRANAKESDLYSFIHSSGALDRSFGDNEFLVVRNPDGCLDLRDLTANGMPLTLNCPGGLDEDVLLVHTDRNDDAGISDRTNSRDGCAGPVGELANSAFGYTRLALVPPGSLTPEPPQIRLLGPTTAPEPITPQPLPPADDCYGYGQDDDLPQLVVMADIGASRFYTEAFVHVPGSIKNMAGLLSNVSFELISATGVSSVTATMLVRRGFFSHMMAYDADVTNPTFAGAHYLRRIDGGPIEARNFPGQPPLAGNATAHALANDTPFSLVQLRAVLVKGRAPDVITDANRDGKFTAADLVASGYTLVSNEARAWIRTAGASQIDTNDANILACPIPGPDGTSDLGPLFYSDLDGDGFSGPGCSTGSSNSKVRVPR